MKRERERTNILPAPRCALRFAANDGCDALHQRNRWAANEENVAAAALYAPRPCVGARELFELPRVTSVLKILLTLNNTIEISKEFSHKVI
tara:strand:+ start:719 stop:991 length:273 start_codon:yes stop_codon:yes gene_type:complete